MSHQAVPCRLMPKRAQKETSYYPSESETGPESEVEDDEDYDAEDKASSSSKNELKINPAVDKIKKKIFPFMSLAAEIKNMIYEYALTSHDEIPLVFKMKGYRHTVVLGDDKTFMACCSLHEKFTCTRQVPSSLEVRPSLTPAIVVLNHETYAQAQPILYGSNEFALEDPKALLAFCITIGPKNCAMLQKVSLYHFGNTTARRALRYPAFAALANAVNLQNLSLVCCIRPGDALRTARDFFRDGHAWLEAVGAKEGRRDAAVDRIQIGSQNISRYGGYDTDDTTYEENLEKMRTTFRAELRRLLKA